MKTMLFGTVCVLSALALVACGDDESGEGGSGGSTTTTTTTGTPTTTTTTTTTTTSSSNSSSTGGAEECPLPDTTDTTTCETACPALYDCGALSCNGATLCAFTGDAAEKEAFVAGCLETCMGQMALIGLIDEEDCGSTISTLKGINAQFAMTCDEGLGGN